MTNIEVVQRTADLKEDIRTAVERFTKATGYIPDIRGYATTTHTNTRCGALKRTSDYHINVLMDLQNLLV